MKSEHLSWAYSIPARKNQIKTLRYVVSGVAAGRDDPGALWYFSALRAGKAHRRRFMNAVVAE